MGIVTRIDLMGWAHFQLFGGKERHDVTVSEFFRIVDVKKARDIACGDSWMLSVKENDTLQAALDKMLDHEEDMLPLSRNSQGEIIGDLRLSEVLWWAEATVTDIDNRPKRSLYYEPGLEQAKQSLVIGSSGNFLIRSKLGRGTKERLGNHDLINSCLPEAGGWVTK